jgi:3-oxoadipate enol-lactonase
MPYAELTKVKLFYTMEGDESKPVLVLSNSLGTSMDMWGPQLERFAKHFRVLRYDTRGHGRSEVVPGPYTIAQLGDDVIALLDHLNIERAHFCGLSMGGITGMWLGVHCPKRLDRLILSNTAAYIGPPENWTTRVQAVQKSGVASIASAVVARWLTPEFAASHPAVAAELLTMLNLTPAAGYTAACIAVRDADLRNDVKNIRAPTLIISGTFDLPTPPGDGHYLQQVIPSARYVELAAAHLSNQEQVAPFTDAVLTFLNTDASPEPTSQTGRPNTY